MITILTDFINLDPSYSLCRVVQNQIKMLTRHDYKVRLVVRKGFDATRQARQLGASVVEVCPGQACGNSVRVTPDSEKEITLLAEQLDNTLGNVVLTHDLIFQASMWKYNVACHRLKQKRRWLHWVHSMGAGAVRQTGKYRRELKERIPGSRLVVMHPEEMMRKGSIFGYEMDEIAVIPNTIDFLDDKHPVTKEIASRFDLMHADIIAVYPCRLDRGKQPHILIEIFEHLTKMHYDARIVFVDFASIAGGKAIYRKELIEQAKKAKVPAFFTSSLEGGEGGAPYKYCVPHQVIMELFEIGDVMIHPSKAESDPLIIPEAMWHRNGLVLNFDLPMFRHYLDAALFGKFSSHIDTNTGMVGDTITRYGNDDNEKSRRGNYMRGIAGAIVYQMENEPGLMNHRRARQERSLEGGWPILWAAISSLTL